MLGVVRGQPGLLSLQRVVEGAGYHRARRGSCLRRVCLPPDEAAATPRNLLQGKQVCVVFLL